VLARSESCARIGSLVMVAITHMAGFCSVEAEAGWRAASGVVDDINCCLRPAKSHIRPFLAGPPLNPRFTNRM